MATLKFENIGIRAVAACVPSKIAYNRDLGELLGEEEVEKTINSIGIEERRVADADVTASDLCFKAAQKLMDDNDIDPASIDLLLFLSQTPDHIIPATAPILQHRLGLPKTTAALDLSLGCSGYVYALSTAFAYAQVSGVERVLLLVGETFSKIVNPKDKVNAPLYGDAGTATLVDKGNFGRSIFTLHSDGEGSEAVGIKCGGYRNFPLTTQDIVPQQQEESNIRSNVELYMNGMDVFNFTLGVVPKSIKQIAAIAEVELSHLDKVIFHQANRFMTDFFVKKLKLDAAKVPYCMDRYGNTSSPSIPLTISSELSEEKNMGSVVMCGFGAGLSWATAWVDMSQTRVTPVIEY